MVVETRYMTSNNIFVNLLIARWLNTTETAVTQGADIGFFPIPTTVYVGIRVWVYHADGSFDEVTAGTAVAIVSGSTAGLRNANWHLTPAFALVPTDTVVVRVYGDIFTPPTTFLTLAIFSTEQLLAQSLDDATWTVYSYIQRRLIEGFYIYSYYWGNAPYLSRIENFTYTLAPVVGLDKAFIGSGFYLILP